MCWLHEIHTAKVITSNAQNNCVTPGITSCAIPSAARALISAPLFTFPSFISAAIPAMLNLLYRLARVCDFCVYSRLKEDNLEHIPIICCMQQSGTRIASVAQRIDIVAKLYGPERAQQIMDAN